MKDEIKEILDDLKNKNSYINDETILTFDEAKLLLDHITNSQEELKSANESITWWTNRFKAVEQENEHLRTQLNTLENTVIKALECIDNMDWVDCEDCVDQVHDILTGGDKDE